MFTTTKFALAGVLAASVFCASVTLAATTAPAPTAPAPAGKAAVGVVCKVAASGDVVHIQAVNTGKVAVTTGDTFAFTIVGPTKKTSETITFKHDLAPGKAVNVTNAIKAKNVVSCTPAA